jgi:hypothetical protein
MMNIPHDIAHKVIDQMRGAPFVLALLIINLVVLIGFTVTLVEISNAIERRDRILERCIK